MLPDAPVGTDFPAVLETCRQFLLTIANAQLPDDLRAKGGASDLVQESLSAAHFARHQFHGRTMSELRAWLRTILRNKLATFYRKYRHVAARDVTREGPLRAEVLVAPDAPVAELIRRENHRDVAAAVARLSEVDRLAIVLRIDHDLPFAEIGARMGRTEEAARKVFTRALTALRAMTPNPAG